MRRVGTLALCVCGQEELLALKDGEGGMSGGEGR